MYVCMYKHGWLASWMDGCMHACMHACMYVLMYVCMCIYIYMKRVFLFICLRVSYVYSNAAFVTVAALTPQPTMFQSGSVFAVQDAGALMPLNPKP